MRRMKKQDQSKPMRFLTKEQMEKLPTKRLLSYKNSLYKVHEKPGFNHPTEVAKNTDAWKQALADAKSVLAGREHIAGAKKDTSAKTSKIQRFEVNATVRVDSDRRKDSHGRVGLVIRVISFDPIRQYDVQFPNGDIAIFMGSELVSVSLLDAVAKAAK